MAKLEHVSERDDIRAFVEEINAQCWRYGYKTQASLGNALGISQVTAGTYLRDPGNMKLTTLRNLIKTLKPDPMVVLKAFGYSAAEIKKIKEEIKA